MSQGTLFGEQAPAPRIEAPWSMAPTHIVELISDTYPWLADRTLCGIKTSKPEALPIVGSHAAEDHIDGYGMPLCPDCEARWRPPSLPEAV